MEELKILKSMIFWLAASLILVWVAILNLPDGKLHLVFCDVGQGDAILASFKNTQVLIDGGPDDKILGCLSDNLAFWDREIEMVILTHPEADHLTGLINVIKRYSVSQIVVNSIQIETAVFKEFREAVISEGAKIYSPKVGDKIKVGQIEFDILWPREKIGEERIWLSSGKAFLDSCGISSSPRSESSSEIAKNDCSSPNILGVASGETNDTSIVLKLSYADFDALLTGDISAKVDEQLAASPVEVLKVAHHGSKYSTTEGLLQKLKPALAIISVGKNSFGHPTQEVLGRLTATGVKVLRTDQEGEIEIVSDGKGYWQNRQ